MSTKRPKISGRGADIYLGSEEKSEPSTSPRSAQDAGRAARMMITTYLPEALIERIQDEWLKRVKSDKKARKAHIISDALEAYFKQLDSKTLQQHDVTQSEHPNSTSSENPDGEPPI